MGNAGFASSTVVPHCPYASTRSWGWSSNHKRYRGKYPLTRRSTPQAADSNFVLNFCGFQTEALQHGCQSPRKTFTSIRASLDIAADRHVAGMCKAIELMSSCQCVPFMATYFEAMLRWHLSRASSGSAHRLYATGQRKYYAPAKADLVTGSILDQECRGLNHYRNWVWGGILYCNYTK